MKYFIAVIALVAGTASYCRSTDPAQWNQFLSSLHAQEGPISVVEPAEPINVASQVDSTEPIAPAEPVATTPNTTVQIPAAAPSPAMLTEEQRATIQAKIDELNSDIAFMRHDQQKLSGRILIVNGATMTPGGYTDKIADEQRQVAELMQQLQENRAN